MKLFFGQVIPLPPSPAKNGKEQKMKNFAKKRRGEKMEEKKARKKFRKKMSIKVINLPLLT